MVPLNSTYYIFLMAIAIAIIFVLSFFILNRPLEHDNVKKIIFTRILGTILLGLIPLGLVNFIDANASFYALPKFSVEKTFISLIVFIPIILFVNEALSNRINRQKIYPIIRTNNWSIGLYTTNILSWLFYTFAYEALFRGLLLFTSMEIYGAFAAVSINTLLYVIAHIPKGKTETIAAIPFGIVFCLVSIFTGSFLAAFVLHCTMAISNDIFCFIHNPNMKFLMHKHHHIM